MSGFTDTTMGVRSIGARTDAAGDPVIDITAEEDRFANIFVSEGYISPAEAFEPTPSTGFDLIIGSGTTETDYYVVEGTGIGQGNYVVRLDQADETVTLAAADLSNPRIDEVYLLVMDNAYDASGLVIPRIAVRKGDPNASPISPGPDSGWLAYALIASVLVPASAADISESFVTDSRLRSQSNVDAPTLGGMAASAFAVSDHDHDAIYAGLPHVTDGAGHPNATGSVDGMESAADKSKLNALDTGAEVNLSGAEVLTLIKTVDGSGSGLNADLLDGQQGSAFAASGLLHDGTYYTESEMNAKLLLKSDKTLQIHVYRTNTQLHPSGFEGQQLLSFAYREDWEGHTNPNSYITDGAAGFYLVEAQMVWQASSAGTIRQVRLFHSGDGTIAFGREVPISASESTIVNASTVVYMNGAQYVQMFCYQDSGINLGNIGGAQNTYLKLTYLGAGG
jgi:hypothetical protein